MLPDQELTSLMSDLESDRVERKTSAAEGGNIRQAICAFANDTPCNGKRTGGAGLIERRRLRNLP